MLNHCRYVPTICKLIHACGNIESGVAKQNYQIFKKK